MNKLHPLLENGIQTLLTSHYTQEKIQEAFVQYRKEAPKMTAEQNALTQELKEVDVQLERAAQAILNGMSFPQLFQKIEQLKQKKKMLLLDLQEKEHQKEQQQHTIEWFSKMLDTILNAESEKADMKYLYENAISFCVYDWEQKLLNLYIGVTDKLMPLREISDWYIAHKNEHIFLSGCLSEITCSSSNTTP